MITGGASGLGYKFAEILLRNEARCIAIIDLPTSDGQNATTALENEFGKGRAVFFSCDITRRVEFENTFRRVINKFEMLDILINNAAMLNDRRWEHTIDLNITALIRSSLLALKYMGKHKGGKGGTIVNISSIAGLSSTIGSAPIYTATKYAVRAFSQTLARFHDRTGIRIVVLCPGVTMTPLIENISDKILDFVTEEEEIMKPCLPTQSCDNVALAMLDLIQKGKNGAVWISEGGQPPYTVDFPHYSQQPLPV